MSLLAINDVNKRVKPLMFMNAKVPHGVSNPVLREEDGKMYIAYFGYTYDRQNLVDKKYRRPSKWALFDIETGKLIKLYDCTEKDFSGQSHEVLYSMVDPTVKKPTENYYQVMDSLFETCRASVLYGHSLDMGSYKAYLNSLYAITPRGYRIFYKDLSI